MTNSQTEMVRIKNGDILTIRKLGNIYLLDSRICGFRICYCGEIRDFGEYKKVSEYLEQIAYNQDNKNLRD